MKIARIDIFDLSIPLLAPMIYPHRTYHALDDSVVRIETDTGLVGWSEVCPLSSTYQPETAAGVRADMETLMPVLIGEDPTQVGHINALMEKNLMGANYAKSTIDIACWDITAKAYNKPLYHLLGGRLQPRAATYVTIGNTVEVEDIPAAIEAAREDGYNQFMIKVGWNSNFEKDIARIKTAGACMTTSDVMIADVNKEWSTSDALRILRATEDIDYFVEQPCMTYEECLSIRRQVRQPMVLDESITDVKMLLRGIADNAFEGIGCKLTRVGGITAMGQIRDICKAAGKFMSVDDAWGSDLSVAAQAHLAISTHPSVFRASYVSTYFSDMRYDLEAQYVVDGYLNTTEKPGLGVEPDMAILGEPIRTWC